ncbi:aromatic ring-hydroxylating dioxygenase subunit alpha [Denitrobaculum tricleocarpae]|uniref:Aromatic ring-hydroxylating dioxygenase subunit alpha n=1 Tax=Denitrobaculum tricleocarpae TaxID=2591009 RepID=A0A545T820_9PROT|nr:aromatic ring-hydroxylating dioxygenase subunit alpha [Denitrobaculum tricleocarpae]TQV73360.1 aromatic ring-hydroxylating dioxygenase subunit alpha [Denitrobaculum tricleocarpae]
MEYVRNTWYVAGWSSEFGRSLTRATILEENVVLYRKSEGGVAALEDRCPHRLMPLSKGKLKDDCIQCGYHGMTFDQDGNCVRIPGQEAIPASAYVRAYPTHERHGIVWIWMGDAEKADPNSIFDLPQFTDPKWSMHHGDALHLKSNYLNVAENLCDPAHVSFVHPTTLGNSASEEVPVSTEKDGDVIVTSRWIRDAPPIGFFQKFGGFTGNVDRWHYYYLHPPCVAAIDFGSADAALELPEDKRDEGVRIFALHFMTPVNATTTIDRWMHLRNTAMEDETAAPQMDEMFRVAFAEDKVILEAIQEEELRPQSRRPIRLAIDKGPNFYRRIVEKMIAAEKQPDVETTGGASQTAAQ